ncbi:hypothetical protein Mal4_00610 [Maioricimonas rarisocia]|uniref:Type I restriction enzyme R protein N-terminal domain-containing protein n=1 Tax=Maioricimonas rarisocia TaxID=2528026 RepID=A0A517Z046_9PLAN|nr:type I restriction enzyme HsdR N-terminal domain-containing protein [Maioricimonas rarisocia]QDU35779.1 hypothetical protein Mal4_00610 [Maioricimonas rarisocia]
MLKIPKRTLDRIREGIKKYQKVMQTLQERDVSEADTVTVVKDILADVFGYDKYLELTGEQQIRGTFCDLAVKIDNKIKYLIEVKAAGVDLNETHLRQVVNYGAQEGIEWIVLTNGTCWHLYRIKFAQPIEHEEVAAFSFDEIDLRKEDDQRKTFLLSREAIVDDAMAAYHSQSQLFNRYTISQVLLLDPVVSVVRREFRRLFPDIRVDKDEIATVLTEEILKREVVESEKAKDAATKVKRTANRVARQAEKAKKKAAEKNGAGDLVASPAPQSVEAPAAEATPEVHAAD